MRSDQSLIVIYDDVNNYIKLNDHLEDTKLSVPFTKHYAKKMRIISEIFFRFSAN